MAAPTCSVTVHVTDINGVAVTGGQSFIFWLAAPFDNSVSGNLTPKQTVTGTTSTTPLIISSTIRDTLMSNGSNTQLSSYPLIGYPANTVYMMSLVLSGWSAVTNIAGTIHLDENSLDIPFTGKLNGPPGATTTWMTIFVYRQTSGVISATGTPIAKTAAQFHTDRTLPAYQSAVGTSPTPPSSYRLIDVCNVGDHDMANVQAISTILRTLGRNVIVLPEASGTTFRFYTPPVRDACIAGGMPKVGRNTFLIPGDSWQWEGSYAGDSPEPPTDAGIDAWAQRQYDIVAAGGWSPSEMGAFLMSDERSWYSVDNIHGWTLSGRTPSTTTGVNNSPSGLAYFRAFLQTVKNPDGSSVDATFFGGSTSSAWSELFAVGRSAQSGTLAQRRLFYWSTEFFYRHSNRTYKKSADALKTSPRFGSTLDVGLNLNNFQNRSYTPGVPTVVQWPGAGDSFNNHADAGITSTDWLDYGECGAGNPHVEDFGGDAFGFTTSLNTSIARMGANRSGNYPGTYCGPHYSGYSIGTHQRRIMSAVAQGAKSLYFYAFGPSWALNGDGYSEVALSRPDVLTGGAEAARQIKGLEDLLYTGVKLPAQVAILFPRSSQPWEPAPLHGKPQDGANPYVYGATMDYGYEARTLYLLLTNHGIPVDWVTEDDLTSARLAPYKLLIATAPNIPEEGQSAISTWAASSSHVLITTLGAGQFDRYNNPLATVANLAGITTSTYTRQFIQDAYSSTNGTNVGPVGATRWFTYHTWPDGTNLRSTSTGGTTLATFEDNNSPAIIKGTVSSGFRYHFNVPLGHAYLRTASPGLSPDPPSAFQESAWYWMNLALTDAGVVRPVEAPLTNLEIGVQASTSGWGIVLVNWVMNPTGSFILRIRPPFTPIANTLHSSDGTTLPLTLTGDGYTATIPSFTTTRTYGVYAASSAVPLSVTINQASGQSDPATTAPINFTAVFSSSVTDFTSADVTVSGTAGATTAIVTGSGTTYNIAVSGMTTSGTVIISIPASVAHDSLGTANSASTSTDNTVTYTISSSGTTSWITSLTPTTVRNDAVPWVGLKFTVGASPITITALGRWVLSGNNNSHTVKIVRASTGSDVVSVSVSTSGVTPGTFAYSPITPITLLANTSYYLVSTETGDSWYDYDTHIVVTGVAVSAGVVYNVSNTGGTWVEAGGLGNSYVPPTFQYQTGTLPVVISRSVNRDTVTDTYNVTLNPAKVPLKSSTTIKVNGVSRVVTAVAINGNIVTWTLATPVAATDSVTETWNP